MSVIQKSKQEKTTFNFSLPKELDKEWRAFVAQKYGGYYRGAFSKEVELAIRHFMHEQSEDKE